MSDPFSRSGPLFPVRRGHRVIWFPHCAFLVLECAPRSPMIRPVPIRERTTDGVAGGLSPGRQRGGGDGHLPPAPAPRIAAVSTAGRSLPVLRDRLRRAVRPPLGSPGEASGWPPPAGRTLGGSIGIPMPTRVACCITVPITHSLACRFIRTLTQSNSTCDHHVGDRSGVSRQFPRHMLRFVDSKSAMT